MLNSEKSDYVGVLSGVPQGSVLGPLLFLVYINDINNGIQSNIRPFADDCIIYKAINDSNDVNFLQADLDNISMWCNNWKMNLNVKKCVREIYSKEKPNWFNLHNK